MKRKLGLSLSISVVFLSLTSGILASIAWFNVSNSVTVDVNGSVVEEYFHTGDGSSANPYVITRPIHFYHLVEFFQRETTLPPSNDFGIDYLYFQVGYDLDNDGDLEVYNYDDAGTYLGTPETASYSNELNMAYYSGNNALMPVGTNEIPFIGSFDGKASQGIVIKNINIHCAETVVVDGAPVNRAASDIGVFGYVADKNTGNTPTVIEDAKFDGINIDLTDVTTTVASSQTGVSHVDNHAGIAYVGYVAGHVHNYYNYSSPTNASPLYDVYVTNATIQGGPGVKCNYGYIGLVDQIDGDTPMSVSEQVTALNGGGGGGGQGEDWGGSIAFDSFNQRLYHHMTNATNIRYKNGSTTYSSGLIKYYKNSSSSVTVHRGGNASTAQTYLTKDPASNYVVYNMIGAGQHKINKATNGSGTTYTADQSVDGTYQPLLIDSDYSVSSKNTGYLTSSNYAYGPGHYTVVDGAVRSASYPNGQISNSFDDTYHDLSSLYDGTTGGPKYTYNGAKLEILTNSSATYSASNYRLVSDDFNSNHTVSNTALTGYTKTNYQTLGLTRYQSARAQLETVLTTSQYVHGIHFMGVAPSASSTITVPNATINGTAKTNYPVLLSAVDFNVKEAGYITLFAGAYYPANVSTSADSFFDLYLVNRDSNDSISSIQKVYKIYQNNDTGEYTYTSSANQTVNNSTLLFDMSYLTNQPPENNVVYYFEIPVGAGEFAIGAVSGKTAGAYLMYLDLGTNGEEQDPTMNEESAIADASLFTQIDFQIDNYVINSCFNVEYVIPTGSTKEKFSITISGGTETVDGHDYTCYDVVIVNTSGNNFTISALLMDNDNNNDNEYYYMYAITYNGGARKQYFSSNTFTGLSEATAMGPLH